MNKLIKAIRYATKAHEGQLRKNGAIPFITHPLAVMHKTALINGVSENMVVAAVLHDVYEDCPGYTLENIREEFGDNVAELVDELTNKFTKESHPHLNRKERKALELERLKKISNAAKQIKLIDRIHNLESRGLDLDHMRKNYLPESEELGFAIGDANIELFAELRNLINEFYVELGVKRRAVKGIDY